METSSLVFDLRAVVKHSRTQLGKLRLGGCKRSSNMID